MRVGPAQLVPVGPDAIIRDVNTDGLADRVMLARSTDLDLTVGDEELCLTGNLADRGQSFMNV